MSTPTPQIELKPLLTNHDERSRLSSVLRQVLGAGPVLALVAFLILFAILSDAFLTGPNLQAIAGQSAILLVIAVGMTGVILLGGIDLSVPGVMAISSMVAVLLSANDRNDNDFGLLAVLAGVSVGAVLGAISGLLNARLRIPSFMATLGVGAVGLGLATVLYGSSPPRLLDPSLRSMGLGHTFGVSNLVFVALGVVLIALWVQRYTRTGRYMYIIGGNEAVARAAGAAVGFHKTVIFAISGGLAGLGGVMASAQLGVGAVDIGRGREFTAITAVVVGGTLLQGGSGGVLRTVVGALIISVLANGMILVGVDQYVQPAVQGVVIVAAIAVTTWRLRRRTRVVK